MKIRIEDPVDGRNVFELRPEVVEFAVAMEAKLQKNDHKTGWHDQPIEAHIKLLRIEMMELDVALDHLGDEAAVKECVDVANFALIIRDKLLARIVDKANHNSEVLTGDEIATLRGVAAASRPCTCALGDRPPICMKRFAVADCCKAFTETYAP